jgi:hypothetical protein
LGLGIVLEFADDDGKGAGKYLNLQLKAGNSHLRKRKLDEIEMFDIQNDLK